MVKVAVFEQSAPIQVLIEDAILAAFPDASLYFSESLDQLQLACVNQDVDLVVADLFSFGSFSSESLEVLREVIDTVRPELIVYSEQVEKARALADCYSGWVTLIDKSDPIVRLYDHVREMMI